MAETMKNDFVYDDMHQYIAGVIGEHNARAAISKLEEYNPELKGNSELAGVFIKELNKVPEEDRNNLIAATLKMSKLKCDLQQENHQSEYSDAYSNFKNVVTRVLPGVYGVAKYGQDQMFSGQLSDEELVDMFDQGTPVATANLLVNNDRFNPQSTPEGAERETMMIVGSCGSIKEDFIKLSECLSRRSAVEATQTFNKESYEAIREAMASYSLKKQYDQTAG